MSPRVLDCPGSDCFGALLLSNYAAANQFQAAAAIRGWVHSGLGPDWRGVGRSRTDNEMVSEYERIDRLPGPDLRWS